LVRAAAGPRRRVVGPRIAPIDLSRSPPGRLPHGWWPSLSSRAAGQRSCITETRPERRPSHSVRKPYPRHHLLANARCPPRHLCHQPLGPSSTTSRLSSRPATPRLLSPCRNTSSREPSRLEPAIFTSNRGWSTFASVSVWTAGYTIWRPCPRGCILAWSPG